ncbi:Four-helical cytokine-like core domain-containing protein [Dioscorea alata]|uniref:Four-helical cytokine-like core domain-containing protein n=1 Tax=Dioscorea alata TaxID=55571 RepID=A0ACB7V1S9_DIOAL|nr:Four-helical cytokine-like core domain-containing protein [Dioscorea alata]
MAAPKNKSSTTSKYELKSLLDDSEKNVKELRSNVRPLIQRVPKLLYKTETNKKKLFIPEVIALGPYHHDNPDLKGMQDYKNLAVKQFVGTNPIHLFMARIKDVISEARQCYKEDLQMEEDEFLRMMFFDGCFILRFIDLFVKNKLDELQMSTNLYGFILKDMFLFENQIPYVVLKALMSVTTVNIDLFIERMIITGLASKAAVEVEPIHLLDLFRTKLLGEGEVTTTILPNADWQLFQSVTEMKDIGIEFKKSESPCLRDIRFSEGYMIHSYLSLPRITIDDSFESRFMNMIAMEMCLDSKLDHGIQSYIWLLDCLVDRADDVKELRSAGILFNGLGSDEQVANLFNEMAADLAPDLHEYHDVLIGLTKHKKNKFLVRFYNTHFSSSWTAISFFAAAFLIILTVLQTVFAIFPRT